MMFGLSKLATQTSDSTGVMFHHIVHHFSTILCQTTVENVPCNATTTNMATCTGDYTHLTSDRPCSFAVRTAVCDGIIVGDFSNAINVAMAGTGIGTTDSKASSDSYGL